MASEVLRTLYGKHCRITVEKESGLFSLSYVVYVDRSRYNGFDNLSEAISVAESLAKNR